ncbi:MAG TPA: hypothetical protein VEO74_12070, partial [Thermoanaerobaculia bacterium]|nr:hypothetical protein [Thermoanaerobaculia bacterium]
MRRRLLVLACTLAVVAGGPPLAAAARPKPVPSLTPAATEKLWRKLVAHPRVFSASQLADCRPLRALFYAPTDWRRVATTLAASASPCAQYFISVPPLASVKTTFRSDEAWRIRALGPGFHAMAEVSVTGWRNWVASTGNSWYDAGVEARKAMAAAGYDVNAGDGWAVDEFPASVRTGEGDARTNMRAFVRGLYDAGGAGPPTPGAVFIIGLSQATSSLSIYQARLQDWYEDAPFWSDMSADVSDWSQELYGDVRAYAVPGATPAVRRDALAAYLEHEVALARAAPPTAGAARSFLEATYSPLGNAAWQYESAFGWTNVTFDLMQSFVSAQTYAMRHFGAGTPDRFGFAWAPNNLSGAPASTFATQTGAILTRVADAIRDSADTSSADIGASACSPSWCGGDLAGATFNTAWSALGVWRPSQFAFTTLPQTIVAAQPSQPLTIELRTADGTALTAGAPQPVTITTSSPTGAFSTAQAGPWSNVLTVAIPSGVSAISVYYLDPTLGAPVITAAAAGKTSASQTETVAATPDVTPPETTLAPVDRWSRSTSATLTFTANEPARFECALDGAAFATCVSPAQYADLAEGTHTFAVRATDAAGNVDATPATATWTIDLKPPNTRIATRPPRVTTHRVAAFGFRATEAGSSFECSLDRHAYRACGARWRVTVRRGVHTLRVRAVDPAGNADPTPAAYGWRVK